MVVGRHFLALLAPLSRLCVQHPQKGQSPRWSPAHRYSPPLLLPSFLPVPSLLTEDYVTSKEERPGVPPKAASGSVFAAVIFSVGICFMQTGFRGFSWMLLFHLTCKG